MAPQPGPACLTGDIHLYYDGRAGTQTSRMQRYTSAPVNVCARARKLLSQGSSGWEPVKTTDMATKGEPLTDELRGVGPGSMIPGGGLGSTGIGPAALGKNPDHLLLNHLFSGDNREVRC